jgi:hypothetical protein
MTWDHSEPFPPDPNAPPPRPDRMGPSGRMDGPPGLAAQIVVALERQLAQLLLIGPAAGAALQRIVHPGRAGVGERQWTRP